MQRDMQGNSYFTPCINTYVSVNTESIRETAFHAAKSIKSTSYALNLPILLQNATVRDIDLKAIKKRQKALNIVKIATLICDLYDIIDEGAYAKITIGQRVNGTFIEYCVTAIETT